MSVDTTAKIIVWSVIGLFIFGMIQCSKIMCHNKGVNYETETKFTYLNGCMVKVNDKWINEENYRGVAE